MAELRLRLRLSEASPRFHDQTQLTRIFAAVDNDSNF